VTGPDGLPPRPPVRDTLGRSADRLATGDWNRSGRTTVVTFVPPAEGRRV